MPQPAERLDADSTKRFATEILLDVETLNIDAASFRQMEEASGGDPDGIAALITETVRRRGKQHNPVTGSGGMLLGRVRWIGAIAARGRSIAVGQRVATLASLSLTPLSIRRIVAVRPESAQVDIEGEAIVFLSAPIARMPTDLPERLALAALDVAGAAPQVARLTSSGETVVVLGAGGKSGLLCAAEARRRIGSTGKLVGVESSPRFADELRGLGLCDHVLTLDARDPIALRDAVAPLTGGRGADLTLSCVNVPGAELGAIVVTRERGRVYFFAMGTSFTAAALGAEGIARDVDLYIGNGYADGHADHTLDLLRHSPALKALFLSRYGGDSGPSAATHQR